MTYKIRVNHIFEHVDVYDTEDDLLQYLNKVSAPLGSMIMEFNALEDEVAMCLADAHYLLDLHLNPKALSNGYRDKKQKLIKLYENLCDSNEELKKTLNSLKAQLDDSSDSRNQFTHASWLYASPSKGVACSKDKSTYRKFELKDIQDSHDIITRTRAHLAHFHRRIQHAYKALKPDT